MKSAVVILTLLGCDCDGVDCEYIRTVSSQSTSVGGCEASADVRGMAPETASYPLVIAKCSVDTREAGSIEIAGNDQPGAVSNRQADLRDAALEHAGSDFADAGSGIRGLLGDSATNSVRKIGSGLKTYAVEPVRSMSGPLLAGLGN